MRSKFAFTFTSLWLAGMLASCLVDSARAAARQETAPAGAQAGTEEGPPEPPPLAIPPGYRYDPRGRRDPFVNPVRPEEAETGPAVPDVRPPGLPGVLLNETQLIGVVSSRQEHSMNVAVFQAPGDRTFIARPGDELLDVVIKQIRPDAVVFEVKPLEGEQGPGEEVVRRLASTPGE